MAQLCSLRNGKLLPSARYVPAAAQQQNATNWRLGIDKSDYESTYKAASAAAKQAVYVPMPRINKNSSNKAAIQGGGEVDVQSMYTTGAAAAYATGGVTAASFKRARPAEGYDRLTASRTNYRLGSCDKQDYYTAHADQFIPPQWYESVQQATIGGWQSGGSYKQDFESFDSIKRGGGGGQGCLGVPFNIVTGADSATREATRAHTGPRRALVSHDRETPKSRPHADAWGVVNTTTSEYDIVSGRKMTPPVRPPRITGGRRHSDSTQPW